jgi:hypothetical protein
MPYLSIVAHLGEATETFIDATKIGSTSSFGMLPNKTAYTVNTIIDDR